MTSVDPLPRLAASLSAISMQLNSISDELRSLQPTSVARPPAYPPPPVHPTPPAYPPPPYRPPYPAAHATTAPPPIAAPPDERPTLWERLSREGAGSRLIAWVGGAVTLVGVLLLLVLAVQRGYVGPVPRLLLGAALAAALLGIAVRVHRIPDAAPGAQALAATGLAVGYLDTVAASAYYRFVPVPAGLLIGLMIAAVGIGIALLWDSQLLATFVVLACAASAVVLARDITLLVGFLLVLQIAAGVPVQRRRWTRLAVAAAAPGTLAVIADALVHGIGGGSDAGTVAVLCLVTTLVQTVLATSAARHRANVAIGLLVTAAIPTLIAALLVTRMQGVALTAGLGALFVGVCLLARTLRLPAGYADAAAAVGLAGLFEAICLGFGGDARALAVLLAATLLAGVAARLRHVPTLAGAALFAAAGLALALGDGLHVRYLAIAPAAPLDAGTIVTAAATGLLLAAAALAVCAAAGRLVDTEDPAAARTCWVTAGVIALYGVSGTILSLGLAISPDKHGFLVGHMLVTLSWTVGALVLLLRHVDSVPLRVAGLALVGAALAKLLLFDLSSLSGIPRVLAFLGAGLVLLAAGARYARLVAVRRP
ncbi:MAG TPA: DUF2339 domain-containing protein [Jatrophihabitans sp.]